MFVGQDRKILDWKDATEECLTPEVQKFRSMHMVSSSEFNVQRLDKLEKVKGIGPNVTFRPQIAASSIAELIV